MLTSIVFVAVITVIVLITGYLASPNRNWNKPPDDFFDDRDNNLPFDKALLAEMIDQGYVSVRSHPDDPDLLIYNYTAAAQYDRVWNDVTEQCRGLIVKHDWIVARPFRKFFNLGEMETIPDGPFIAQPKMDGSLGIIYRAPDGVPAVATRGSFESDQAKWATKWLRSDVFALSAAEAYITNGVTALVEIIYPENRIVVDYGDKTSLTLLALIDNETGLDYTEPLDVFWPDDIATETTDLTLELIEGLNENSTGDKNEGFVIRWPDGTRAKVKSEDYVRLHRILTGVTPRKIHEMLMTNMSIDQLKEVVPDEFYDWMKAEADKIQQAYTEVETAALAVLAQVDRDASRKDQAEFINSQPNSGLVFRMLDGKDYSEQIWKMVRPAGETAFRRDIDS